MTLIVSAPNGIWYACCLDSNYQLVLGDTKDSTINEIYFSKERQRLIDLLENREYRKIGGPCLTVNCCYFMHRNRLVNGFFRYVHKRSLLVGLCYRYFYF